MALPSGGLGVSHGGHGAAMTSPDARQTLRAHHYRSAEQPTKYHHSKKNPTLPYASGGSPLPLQATFTSLVVHSTGACPALAQEGPLNIHGLQVGVGGARIGVSHHSSATCVHSLSSTLCVHANKPAPTPSSPNKPRQITTSPTKP